MSFTSLNFWFLFPIIFIVYWAIPARYCRLRNLFLLIVSYLLYMSWKPAFALVLLAVTIICHRGGYLLDIQNDAKRKKTLCQCLAVLGLLPLLVFKYYNFLNDSLTGVLEAIGLHFSLPGLNWTIPVGISFFTFQAVGYLLDVYHKRVTAEKYFIDFALFVSFFPQVVSGPISTANELMPQIKKQHQFDYSQAVQGLRLLLYGLFMKLVIADRFGQFVDLVYEHYEYYSGVTCLKAAVAYSIQIYFDFCGYSFLAIGLAKALGFNLIYNFKRPYLAASVTEFWRRWHISLTRWLTTHIYIGLGGSRCGKFKQHFNILVTFLVSGLWHGANWTFVFWGMLHGLFQIVEKSLFGEKIKSEIKAAQRKLSAIGIARILFTFVLGTIAWVFFRMPTLSDGFGLIARIFANAPGRESSGSLTYIAFAATIAVFVHDLVKEYHPKCKLLYDNRYAAVRWGVYAMMFILILTYGVLDSSSFIYASF